MEFDHLNYNSLNYNDVYKISSEMIDCIKILILFTLTKSLEHHKHSSSSKLILRSLDLTEYNFKVANDRAPRTTSKSTVSCLDYLLPKTQ